jgi:predicted secreted protein
MAKINGTSFLIWLPDAPVATEDETTQWFPLGLSTSCSLNINSDTPDATTKDSGGWEEVIAGMKSWDGTFDSFVDFDLSGYGADLFAGFNDVYDYLDGRNKIKIAIGVEGVGSSYYYGDAFITNLSTTADKEATVPFSGSFKGTGALTKASGVADMESSATHPATA